MPDAKSEQNSHQREHRDGRNEKRLLQALDRAAPPGDQRTDTGQKKKEQADRHVHAIEERRIDADLLLRDRLRDNREQRTPKYCKAAREENQVIEQEARLARDNAFELRLALE